MTSATCLPRSAVSLPRRRPPLLPRPSKDSDYPPNFEACDVNFPIQKKIILQKKKKRVCYIRERGRERSQRAQVGGKKKKSRLIR